jgi:hypothetical protein
MSLRKFARHFSKSPPPLDADEMSSKSALEQGVPAGGEYVIWAVEDGDIPEFELNDENFGELWRESSLKSFESLEQSIPRMDEQQRRESEARVANAVARLIESRGDS